MTRRQIILFSLAAAVYLFAAILEPAGIHDEGLIVSGADRILHGGRPYVDFNSGYPPGQFYTVALIFRIFGTSLLAARIWDILWRLATVLAAIWLAREAGGKHARLGPVAIVAALAGGIGFHLYPMITAMLPCLAAVAAAFTYERTREPRWIFASGLLLGATALYRHDLAAAVAIVIAASLYRDRRALLFLTGGAGLVAAPALAWLFATIPLPYLRAAFLDFLPVNAAARHLPLPVLNLLLPAAIILSTARRQPRLAALAALTLLLAMQRFDTAHAFPALVFCAMLLAASGNTALPRRGLVAAALVFYGVVPAAEWAYTLRITAEAEPSGIRRAGPVRISPDQARAVRYIQDHLPPGEPLFTGTATHSRISVNDALLSFLAERPSPTRYYMWLPGQTNTAAVQSEIVLDLQHQQVAYAILYDVPLSTEPNASSVDTGVRTLDNYLAARYQPAAVFGRYRILQAR